jgi:hypothetical protein
VFSAMNAPNSASTAGEAPVTRQPDKQPKRSARNSIWWKRGENPVQHVPTGTLYARVEVKGKTLRAS